MIITDGKKTVEIELTTWDGSSYSPDWSTDFFSAGALPYNDEANTYSVEDVDYYIEQAIDWRECRGDFYGDESLPGVERCVTVTEV